MRFVLFFLCILLTGCAGRYTEAGFQMPREGVLLSEQERITALHNLLLRRQEISSVRLLGDLTLADGTSARAVIAASFPEKKIRIEVLPPQTGQSLLIFLMREDQIQALYPIEKRALQGSVSPKTLRRIFGAALEPEDLFTFLTGRIVSDVLWGSIDLPGSTLLKDKQNLFGVSYNHSLTFQTDIEKGLAKKLLRQNVFNRSPIWTATLDSYEDFDGIAFPLDISLILFEPSYKQLQLNVKSVRLNTEIQNEVFQISVPASYKRETF